MSITGKILQFVFEHELHDDETQNTPYVGSGTDIYLDCKVGGVSTYSTL